MIKIIEAKIEQVSCRRMIRFLLLAFILILPFSCLAEQFVTEQPLKQICPIQSGYDSNITTNNMQMARRGCCSHHGGVCGCDGGMDMCCDGKQSPTCECDSLHEKVTA